MTRDQRKINGNKWYKFRVENFSNYKTILDVLPFSTLLQQISLPCQTAIITIVQTNPMDFMILLVVGPIWLVFLRQLRNIRRTNTTKINGSRSLLVYFVFIIGLFVISHFVDIGCETDKPYIMHNFTLIPEHAMFVSLEISMFFGGPIWFIIFLIEKFLITKIVVDSISSNKS